MGAHSPPAQECAGGLFFIPAEYFRESGKIAGPRKSCSSKTTEKESEFFGGGIDNSTILMYNTLLWNK